ncbi:protein folded gastrulation [Drosophila rhopaloa]|uniref:Folded gastrulation N-terminal domain-containing protein n=1 Tax=Drosophila rhopaloa TaxID=1041015 RepID=A0ABM5GXX0_DRORH|nr:protein folded gastrulation [Drosophila rhopaloa]XP_016971332.2 protein folded gastrulation [Drosophila rhopaloa]
MAPPNCLLAVLALTVFLGANNGLPITSRPIEGNVQRMVWEDWVNLDPEQRNLTKEKKVTAKSIFTLPFRHCPQGHTLYNQLCIPQSNIDPTDLVKQELILAGSSNGSPPPPPIADYDYGDDTESEEIVYDLSVIPTAMQDGGAQDQALPSEDAPLKFNIFEKKFPTGTGEPPEELPLPPDMVAATHASSISSSSSTTTAATSGSTATTTTTTASPPGETGNRIAGGDLQAAPSNALSTTATLTRGSNTSTSSSNSSNSDFGQVEAIVLPAGQAQDGSVQLVTSSLVDDSDDSSTSTAANGFINAEAEADLAQLLKVDAFLPAYDGSIELLPPLFSHRKVAPPLSADQDVKPKQADEAAGELDNEEEEEEEETTTDIVPTEEEEEEEYTTETTTTTADDTTVAEASMDTSPPASSTSTSTSTSTSSQTSPHPPEEPEIDERENRLVLIKSKVQPVQLTTTTSATATVTPTATTAADSSSSSTDRFHYQHFVEDVAASSTTATAATATPELSSSSSTTSEPIEQNNMLPSDNDNLMTNTIGGQGEEDDAGGHKATSSSEMNAQQELRLINELVKGKQRKQHQQQQQQQQQLQQQQQQLKPTSTEATPTEDATYSNWSKVMPQLGRSTSEAESTTETAATSSQVNESRSTANAAAATSEKHLSITNRSNRNSKIIRVEQLAEEPAATAEAAAVSEAAAIAAAAAIPEAAATAAATPPNSSSNPDGYKPFWWLPSIGWRVDRQVDRNGEDQSLLLRFFSTFRGSDTATATR